ncbi:excinuclease ABC subunit UvrC [Hydrogenobaculum acidophilum]
MELAELIEKAPEEPGVYIFKNQRHYIYIGKAVSLKKRLLQHLKERANSQKEENIFRHSTELQWIVTNSEYEALLLEMDLIRTHKPKYNVLLKHGSGYPIILITDEDYPTVKITRDTKEKGEAFGPFLNVNKAIKIKKLIHSTFKLRTCEEMPKRPTPCMDYHLGLCSGPCANLISKEDYAISVKSAKAFLSGNVKDVLPILHEKIEQYASNLAFEKAAFLRDQVLALQNIVEGQGVFLYDIEEADVFYLEGYSLWLFIIRNKRLVAYKEFSINKDQIIDHEEMLGTYYMSNIIPKKIITNFDITENFRLFIKSKRKDTSFSLNIPKQLLKIIEKNVILKPDTAEFESEFHKLFGKKAPKLIECFDISHFQGHYTVGSIVVWEEGSLNKSKYRRYKIKTVDYIDDFASLKEVLSRRAKRIVSKEDKAPDMWLIDGGKGQLSMGIEVKEKFLLNIYVCSLAKKEEIIYTEDGLEIPIKDNQALYRVFGLLRDEAHRFAITYNRNLRSKEFIEDTLSKVKGVGKIKREIIYRHFDSLYDFIKSDDEKLKKLGISKSIKESVKKILGDI